MIARVALQHKVAEPAHPRAPCAAPPPHRAPETSSRPRRPLIEPPNRRATGHLQDCERVITLQPVHPALRAPQPAPEASSPSRRSRGIRVDPAHSDRLTAGSSADRMDPTPSPNLPIRARSAGRGSTPRSPRPTDLSRRKPTNRARGGETSNSLDADRLFEILAAWGQDLKARHTLVF
jgi:hypothetical protein